MIVVARIDGESVDLINGTKTNRTIVLTNGKSEIAVEVSDEVIEAVLRMGIEESAAPDYEEAPSTPVNMAKTQDTASEGIESI